MDIYKQYNLTLRQKDVVLYLVRGYTNKQIAETLFISERTVESHLRELYRKLNVKNRTAATDLLLNGSKIGQEQVNICNNKPDVFQIILSNILAHKLKTEDGNPCSAEYHLAMSVFAARSNCNPEYIQSLPHDFKEELNNMCALIRFT